MVLFRKLGSGSLSRAIVALVRRTGNKIDRMAKSSPTLNADQREKVDCGASDGDPLKFSSRRTITVETERLLIVRSERRSSTTR